jgi:putative PIN family toxin of toxin-antitoxin system
VRIVLDTNVLVSGLLNPFGPPGEIVRLVSSGAVTLCLDARVASEYAQVLRRPKFGFEEDAVAALLDYVEYRGHMIASSPLPEALPDPADEPFLEIALASGAEFLVTGNRARFPDALCHGANIVSPSEFMAAFRERPA